jgi:hypothetical protein
MKRLAAAVLVLASVSVAHAQLRVVIADRANNSLWTLNDISLSGAINEPAEVIRFFSGANAAGTAAPNNPTCMAIRCDGRVVMGDQGNQTITFLHDLNGDNDAQDIGESRVVASTGNASGVRLGFPTGAAFDAVGDLYIVNASNTMGDDAIYKLHDLTGDGDFMDAGEIAVYVGPGTFGGLSTNFSPQEIFFSGDTLFLHNSNGSSPSQFGMYACRDLNHDGDADDPTETTFFGPIAASGIAASAGFTAEPDLARPGSIYMQQLATGGVDQVVRVTDNNNDGDALDAGEAVLVWSSGESGFTSVDVMSRVTGEVYVTDNSGKRVIELRDLDGDNLFNNTTERRNFYVSASGIVGDIRQIVDWYACQADRTGDGGVGIEDLLQYLADYDAGGICADMTGDGGIGIEDLLAYLGRYDTGC